jgi:PDZ domain-containing secreted protein
LLIISKDQAAASKTFDALKNQEVSDAKNILKAHENLTAADQENVGKFQDVIAFLRNQVDKQEKHI